MVLKRLHFAFVTLELVRSRPGMPSKAVEMPAMPIKTWWPLDPVAADEPVGSPCAYEKLLALDAVKG